MVYLDLTITTEKLVALFATMDDYYLDDVETGLRFKLSLPWSKVAKIHSNCLTSSLRRDAYLDLYATDHPCPSWRQIAAVLGGVDLDCQAGVVKSTYIQGTTIIAIHLSQLDIKQRRYKIINFPHHCLHTNARRLASSRS